MGYGDYSVEAHKAMTQARAALPKEAVFARNDCDPRMNPRGVAFRESRDSAAHPESVGIVFALDVSGSMGEIPHQLATETLPHFMETVLTVLPDPQVLFMAFGNAFSDRSPLQVGQFESEADRMDQWLRAMHLEGDGGPWGESYDLAMYFGARHTKMDCLEKRGKKGYFFMTGDEVAYIAVDPGKVQGLIGDTLAAPIPFHEITAELLRSFHVFFLIPDEARAAAHGCLNIWSQSLHERALVLATPEDTAVVCALLIGVTEGHLADEAAIAREIEQRHGRTGEAKDRVLRTVKRYAEAFWRGPIAGPKPAVADPDPPKVHG